MLTYLFTATFTDKTQIKQEQKDEATQGEGNTYADVLRTIQSGNPLVLFQIDEQKIWNPTSVLVNLITGVITVNGVSLLPEVVPPSPLTLYWTMRVTQTMQMKHKGDTLLSRKTMPETRVYFLGWESQAGIRHVIGVD